MTPRVAIITRTKDRPLFLARAIESVLGQSFSDWRHVIVNDGGNREALETLLAPYRERYGDRLQVIHHATAQGMQQAANAGIAASESTFVTIHDDDDSWAPGFLGSVTAFLEEKGSDSAYQGVITQTLQVEEKVTSKGKIKEIARRPYIPLPQISLFRVGYENPFPPIAFCYRRSAYDSIGVYDPRFTVAGDYDFNFRFLRKYEIGIVAEPLAFYHVRASAKNAAHANSVVTGADEHKRRYNEFKNHYLRGEDPSLDPALAVGLNAAKFLVEIEWLAHEINRRAEKIEAVTDATSGRIPTIEARIERGLSLQDNAFRELLAHAQDPRTLDHLEVLARDLGYLNRCVGDFRKQSAAETEEQVARIGALTERLETRAADILRQQESRAVDILREHEARAVDILREIQTHHTAMHEAMREKVLLQIGPFRVAWKKKRRAKPQEA